MGRGAADLAIGWAQLQMKGGWSRIATTTALLTAAVVFGVVATVWSDPGGIGMNMRPWTAGLLMAQTMLLVLVGSGRVGTAIRKDLDSKLIESHRMMPLSPPMAIVGYIVGATAQIVALAGAAFLVGLFTSSQAGVMTQRWIGISLLMLMISVLAWVTAAFAAFAVRAPLWAFVLIGVPLSNAGVTWIIPGVSLLLRPIFFPALLGFGGRGPEITWADICALGALLVIGAHFFIGACRRYRSADEQALGPILSLTLLATWVAISIVAHIARPMFVMPFDDVAAGMPLIASLVASMLVAVIPISAGATALTRWQRRRALDDPALGPRPLGPIAATVIASAAIALITLTHRDGSTYPLTAAVILLGLLPLACISLIMSRGRGKAFILMSLWAAVAWGVPLVIDAARAIQAGADPELGPISTASPIGALIVICQPRDVAIWSGLVVMSVAALGWMALANLDVLHRRAKTRLVEPA